PEGDRIGHRTVAVVELLESIELSIGDEFQDRPIGVVARRRRPSAKAALPLVHGCMRATGRFGSPAPRRPGTRRPAARSIRSATASGEFVPSTTTKRLGS